MEKKLAVNGNSLCLVIDQPIAKLLGLTSDSIVRLTIDGQRLIVEPRDKVAPRRTVRSITITELNLALWGLDRRGMKEEHFRALSDGTPREIFDGAMGREKLDPLTVTRIVACRDRRNEHPEEPWIETIAAVSSTLPRPPDSVPFTYQFKPFVFPFRSPPERSAAATVEPMASEVPTPSSSPSRLHPSEVPPLPSSPSRLHPSEVPMPTVENPIPTSISPERGVDAAIEKHVPTKEPIPKSVSPDHAGGTAETPP